MKRSSLIVFTLAAVLAISSVFTVDVVTAQSKSIDSELLSTMKWRELGPYRGGRSGAVTGVDTQPEVFYFGGTGSGIWKSTNSGMTWAPVMDKNGTSSVGDIRVSKSDPNIVYAGMGEHPLRGNISHGDGVYKSVDAGETWTNVGLKESRQIGRLRIHPTDPNIVYVAALGHVYAPPGEFRGDHGVFKTTDGGATWTKILAAPNNVTGAVDITMDANNPRVLYAAMWEISRSAYSMTSGGEGSGLYKSVDAGATWKKLEGGGLPKGIMGRIGVAVSPANSDVVYAQIESDKGGMYRSADAGKTWRRMNEDRNLRQRAWYYTHVYADPKSENTVYVLNTSMYKSIDNGKTFERIGRGIHGDHHALWLNPDNPKIMIGGNDGGANVSRDGGQTWTDSEHPTIQFYGVETDDEIPYNVYGAQQDNSTIKVNSKAGGFRGAKPKFHAVGGGESGHIVPDPRDHNIVYAGSYGGLLTRYDHNTGYSQNIQPYPDNPMGWGAADLKYRFQWTAPIMISKFNPTKLYHAGNVLFRSTDEGMSWTAVSPDLTKNDKSKQGPSGGPLTHDNTSVEYYCTIFALEESPLKEGLIWVGSDDGLVHISQDDAATWQNITPKDMPEWGLISSMEPSHFDEGTAYIAVDNHEYDDMAPYAYKTTNYGKSWKLITNGLPENDFVRVVRADPVVKGLLYLGTETAMFYSLDDGDSWHSLQLNLPRTPIHDLEVKQNDLIAGTHGRGFWILDDVTVLHELRAKKLDGDYLLNPRDTYNGQMYFAETINFYLKDAPEGEVKLTFLDSDGKEIDTYSTKAKRPNELKAEKGMNQMNWNMSYPGMVTVPNHPMWAASTRGPRIVPGVYTVRLENNGATQQQTFEVKMLPSVAKYLGGTQAGLEEQRNFLLKIRDKATEVHEMVNELRGIKSDIASLMKRVKKAGGGDDVLARAKEITESLSSVEAKILQVKSQSSQDPLNFPIRVNNKIAALNGVVGRSFKAPTKQSYEVYEQLVAEFAEYKIEYDALVKASIPELNEMVKSLNIPAVIIK